MDLRHHGHDDGADDHTTFAAHAALIAQLHYDRSDIARISPSAAAAMDIVIAMVTAAVRQHGAASERRVTAEPTPG